MLVTALSVIGSMIVSAWLREGWIQEVLLHRMCSWLIWRDERRPAHILTSPFVEDVNSSEMRNCRIVAVEVSF